MIEFLIAFACLACASPPDEAAQVRLILERQQSAWNRGDIEGFMEGYEKGDALIFVSGTAVSRGWEPTLRRYRDRYSTREAMGALTFSELEVRVIDGAAAVVLGRWSLERRDDRPHGVFTLVFRKGADGWKIVHDHTSQEQ